MSGAIAAAWLTLLLMLPIDYSMGGIKVISFDIEGTLVTPDFSIAIWHEGIPSLYAQRNKISLQEAKARIEKEYQEIGEMRVEWYDIKYWFQRFQLSHYQQFLESYRHRVVYYPETIPVLASLTKRYILIATSSSVREFLPYLLVEINRYFTRVFSSTSDYNQLKTPSFYLKVCQEMNILPEEMVHIGDNREFDFTNPRQVGINALHLNRKANPSYEGSLTNLREVELMFS